MKQPTQALGLAFAITATLAAATNADARTLATIAGKALVPLNHDPTFDDLSVSRLLNGVLSRWGIPFKLEVKLPPLVPGGKTSKAIQAHKRHRNHRRLLGGLIGGIASPVTNLLNNVIADPLFGSNVVKARSDDSDSEWYGTLSFGSPLQDIKLNFDTGSSDLFLFAPTCTSCSLSNHTAFVPSKSKTYRNSTSSWSIGYGDGSGASGYTSFDTTSITSSNVRDGALQLNNFLFALATSVSSPSWATSETSGLVGLAQDRLARMSNGRTIFSALVSERKLERDVLGIRLVKKERGEAHRVGVTVDGGGGAYTFGYVEERWIVGGEAGLTWTDVTSSNYWGLPMDDVQMGGKSVLDSKTPRRAILDTGTSLIITSTALAASIHTHIPDAYQSQSGGIWIIPCNQPSAPGGPVAQKPSSSSLPNLVNNSATSSVFFVVAGRRFGVPLQDLAWKPLDSDGFWCVSGVQGGVEGFTILGAMFIKNHYVALRYNDKQGESLSVGIGDRTDVEVMV
ncbi:hypothetical protein M407DRAFT_231761 [Tulasnella calospora MUT 4182]|uniref:Peptidase A1 domain-containing protein n=1 Tax=Tulasnella calospora MUT 4182 TaxID=1051891 RepID=A0A0C3MIV2_9AGAM|nr:hypothetical protein M407DRAFT_231761 [Tulasnella calospora MUT 4182]